MQNRSFLGEGGNDRLIKAVTQNKNPTVHSKNKMIEDVKDIIDLIEELKDEDEEINEKEVKKRIVEEFSNIWRPYKDLFI